MSGTTDTRIVAVTLEGGVGHITLSYDVDCTAISTEDYAFLKGLLDIMFDLGRARKKLKP